MIVTSLQDVIGVYRPWELVNTALLLGVVFQAGSVWQRVRSLEKKVDRICKKILGNADLH